MISKDEQIRAAIAEQAGEWFVANDEGPLDAERSAALVGWLKASPAHVEEFLGVAVIARDLREACADPEHAAAAVLAGARAADDGPVRSLWSLAVAAVTDVPARRWQTAAVATAALGVVCLSLLVLWSLRPAGHIAPPAAVTALHFQTGHGEQQTHRLADGSVLHLNTDSAATVSYSDRERLVVLNSGEADFEVIHAAGRAFRVLAGPAQVLDLGTRFDVRLESNSTLVTVVEGQVAVGRSQAAPTSGANSLPASASEFVQLKADQQLRVGAGEWPATPATVDARNATAWLHRKIVFERQPLEHVANEFNRYAPQPIEIVTPNLRNLEISGVFTTDDTAAFVAFLRSLDGVRVEVTSTRVIVSQN